MNIFNIYNFIAIYKMNPEIPGSFCMLYFVYYIMYCFIRKVWSRWSKEP